MGKRSAWKLDLGPASTQPFVAYPRADRNFRPFKF